MSQNSFKKLHNISLNFGEIAKSVNASSLDRKEFTENAIAAIEELSETSDFFLKEVQVISKENLTLRNRHNQVLSSFNTLNLNVKKQHDILKQLKIKKGLNSLLLKQGVLNNKNLSDTLKQGKSFLEEIISNSNEIILMDKEIIVNKKRHLSSISKLRKSTQSIIKDAEKAIDGSKLNFDRGKALSKKLQNIESTFAKKDVQRIKDIIEEFKKGWKLAIKVNNSSQSQFDFAEEVYTFAKLLNESSEKIKKSVIEKHSLFTKNLDPLMQMAVLIAVDCFDYVTGSEELIEELMNETFSTKPEIYHLRNDLYALIKIVTTEIESIAALNLDMTDSIDANSRLEEKAVQLTAREINLTTTITKEVEMMTEATRYPIEGSAKNIRNGMEVENTLKELLKELR